VKHYSDVTGHYVRFDTRSADEETVNIRVADLLRQLPRGDKLTVILDHGDRRTSERVLMAGDQFAYRGRNRTAGLLAMHTLRRRSCRPTAPRVYMFRAWHLPGL
jgi:uncharacterized protein (DUF2249 family)